MLSLSTCTYRTSTAKTTPITTACMLQTSCSLPTSYSKPPQSRYMYTYTFMYSTLNAMTSQICTCFNERWEGRKEEMRRKEEWSKQGQTNNKSKQHSTPKAVTFPMKDELAQVGLEPTTLYTLDRALYHWATKAAQLAGPKSHISCTCKVQVQ